MSSRASSSSSPSINTPPDTRARSRSSSASYSTYSHNDESDAASALPYASTSTSRPRKRARKSTVATTAGGAGQEDDYTVDPNNLTSLQCEWGTCQRVFYELEPLIEHLNARECRVVRPFNTDGPYLILELHTQTPFPPTRKRTSHLHLHQAAASRLNRPTSAIGSPVPDAAKIKRANSPSSVI